MSLKIILMLVGVGVVVGFSILLIIKRLVKKLQDKENQIEDLQMTNGVLSKAIERLKYNIEKLKDHQAAVEEIEKRTLKLLKEVDNAHTSEEIHNVLVSILKRNADRSTD